MGSDDDVDRPVGNAFKRLRNLFGRAKTRKFSDCHGPGGKAVGKRARVLLGK